MGVGVIGEFVTFGDDALENVGIKNGVLAHDKERGLDPGMFENVEQARRILRMRAIVKSQCDAVSFNVAGGIRQPDGGSAGGRLFGRSYRSFRQNGFGDAFPGGTSLCWNGGLGISSKAKLCTKDRKGTC